MHIRLLLLLTMLVYTKKNLVSKPGLIQIMDLTLIDDEFDPLGIFDGLSVVPRPVLPCGHPRLIMHAIWLSPSASQYSLPVIRDAVFDRYWPSPGCICVADALSSGDFTRSSVVSVECVNSARKFAVVDCVGTFPGATVHEVIDGTRPLRPVFDVDAAGETNPEGYVLALLTAINDVFTEKYSFDITDSIRICTSSSSDKLSLHIVIIHCLLADAAELAALTRDVASRIAWHTHHLDIGLAKRLFSLRALGSPKLGTDRIKLATHRSMEISCSPREFFVQDGMSYGLLLSRKYLRDDTRSDDLVVDDDTSDIVRIALDSYPGFEFRGRNERYLNFNRLHPSWCAFCNETHHTDNTLLVYQSRQRWWAKCRHAPAGVYPRQVSAPGPCETPAGVPSQDKYDTLLASDCISVSAQYVSDCHDITSSSGDVYVSSPWGTGKTKWYRDLIASRAPTSTVLIVSSRISLTEQLLRSTSASDYRKLQADWTQSTHPCVVFQIDSICRIPEGHRFDVIIVDEFSQLVAHVGASGSGSKARRGLTRLKWLVMNAGRLIVTDNDLTSAHVESFKMIRSLKPSIVIKNTFKRWEGCNADIIEGKNSPKRVRSLMMSRLDEQWRAKLSGGAWHGTVIACHTLKEAASLAVLIRGKYGHQSVKLYTGETDDYEKQRDLSDVNACWGDILAVIFTSTISVGVSFDDGHIDAAFAFFRASGNQAAPQSAQMLMRCRQIKSWTISIGGTPHNAPLTPFDFYNECVLAQNRWKIPSELCGSQNPLATVQTDSSSEMLSAMTETVFEARLWLGYSMEQGRSSMFFSDRLCSILAGTGITVTRSDAGTDFTRCPEWDSSLAESSYARATLMTDNIGRTAETITELTDASLRSSEEKAGLRAYYITTGLCMDPTRDNYTPEWFEYYEPLVAPYQRLVRYIAGNETPPDPLDTRSDAEASRLVVSLLDSIGLSITGDDNKVSLEMLDPVANPAAAAAADEINKHASRLWPDDIHAARRASAGCKTRKSLVGIIDNVLERHFGGLLRPKYANERCIQQKRPSWYELEWKWATDNAIPPLPPPPSTTADG